MMLGTVLATVKVELVRAEPRAATSTALRANPRAREATVPAAITLEERIRLGVGRARGRRLSRVGRVGGVRRGCGGRRHVVRRPVGAAHAGTSVDSSVGTGSSGPGPRRRAARTRRTTRMPAARNRTTAAATVMTSATVPIWVTLTRSGTGGP